LLNDKKLKFMGSFFHTPKPKHFNFRPRFYDPDKEDLEMREQRIKEELGIETGKNYDRTSYRDRIKGSFRNQGKSQSKTTAEARRTQNTRLIFMIIILALVFYLFFYSNFSF
jgi:hypothetical protein